MNLTFALRNQKTYIKVIKLSMCITAREKRFMEHIHGVLVMTFLEIL